MTKIKLLSSNKSFGGFQKVYSHYSKELDCEMKFAIYLPPQSEISKLPVLYWLSGLTCDENNFIQKAGAQSHAASHGIIIVCPDTSPRGPEIAKYDSDVYDFGSGAGFYIDAITDPWNKHFKMFTYVTKEIVEVVNHNFPTIPGLQSICGHSMGGHGALISALRCPGHYKSVSAFAPIANPSNPQCQWGQKALAGYLGDDKTLWNDWDATELVTKYNGPQLQLLIDQGSDDQFLKDKQLLPENLIEACRKSRIGCVYNLRDGYDHSYYFIATFVGEHIDYHAKFLKE